jgi:hypothetical protein
MKLHVLDKTDALGHDGSSQLKATSLLSGSRAAGPLHDAFNLGRRIDILKTGNQGAIPSYLAEEATTTHYLEVPFRNFYLALIDNASAEYTFLTSFFVPSMSLGTVSILWPRLQVVIDHNCESVRAFANATPSKPGRASAVSSAAPHVTTQCLGQLLRGILDLSSRPGGGGFGQRCR